MSLIDSVNKLNNTQAELLTEKQRKEKEKEKIKIEKYTQNKIQNFFILQLRQIYKNKSKNKSIEDITKILLEEKDFQILLLQNKYLQKFNVNIHSKKDTEFIQLNYYNWLMQSKKEFEAIKKIDKSQETPPNYKTIIYNGIERQYQKHGIKVYYTLEEGRKNYLQKFDLDTYQMNEFYKNINNKFYKEYKEKASCLTFKNILLAIIGGFTLGFLKEFKKILK